MSGLADFAPSSPSSAPAGLPGAADSAFMSASVNNSSSNAAAANRPPPYRIPMLPLPPAYTDEKGRPRRVSQSSSCAPVISKPLPGAQQRVAAMKAALLQQQQQQQQLSMSVTLASSSAVASPNRTVNADGTAANSHNNAAAAATAAASPGATVNTILSASLPLGSTIASLTLQRRPRNTRPTLSEPSTRLNKLMSGQLREAEKERRRSNFFATQPEQDDDAAAIALSRPSSPSEFSGDSNSAGESTGVFNTTLFGSTVIKDVRDFNSGKDGPGSTTGGHGSSASLNAASLAQEAEQRRREANELLKECAEMFAALAPDRGHFERETVREGPSDEELERQRQLEWERRNKMRPLDDDFRDFACPRKWGVRRRVEAKLEFFRHHPGANEKLQERLSFYRQCDRELMQSARDGAEWRQAKMQAMVNGDDVFLPQRVVPPASRPNSARASARSWPAEKARRERDAALREAAGSPASPSGSPTAQRPVSPTQTAAAVVAVGGAAAVTTSTAAAAAHAATPDGKLSDALHGHSEAAAAAAGTAPGARAAAGAGGGVGGGDAGMRRPQSARPTTAASTRSRPDYSVAGEGGWVRQNYSAHVIPIVELPPRDAATWHVMNQRWLARSMRHRGDAVKERVMAENSRLDAAFFENKSDEQLRGHYGTPASGVVPRPLSARSTQSETQKWRIRGIRN